MTEAQGTMTRGGLTWLSRQSIERWARGELPACANVQLSTLSPEECRLFATACEREGVTLNDGVLRAVCVYLGLPLPTSGADTGRLIAARKRWARGSVPDAQSVDLPGLTKEIARAWAGYAALHAVSLSEVACWAVRDWMHCAEPAPLSVPVNRDRIDTNLGDRLDRIEEALARIEAFMQ